MNFNSATWPIFAKFDPAAMNKSISYLLALVACVVALWLRYLLVPFLGESNPYLAVWVAVVFTSWCCGLGPSIFATLLSVLGTTYFFLSPLHSFTIESATERNGILCFLIFSAAIIAMGESNRRAAAFRRSAEAQLKAANDHLETRVDERTSELRDKNELLLRQQQMVRELSGQLLKLRDEERRRIARELHDGVGQLLAAACMEMARVRDEEQKLSPEAAKHASESTELVKQAAAEIRTMSHLLHPPLLDEIGLEAAVSWLAQGFTERSGIVVDFSIEPGFSRLPDTLELAVFRVVQESLTNVHKHSGSKTARIHLLQADGYVHCEIRDEGTGISPEKMRLFDSYGSIGVGLRGMRERVSQLGGVLDVHSSARGTTVTAVLPIKNSDSHAD
jgi:signal transduction histidine kinase